MSAARWRMPPVIRASLWLHAAALLGVLLWPAGWAWALGLVVLDHLVLTALGLWPRSTWLGQNMLRLPAAAAARGEVALTLDDGPDPEVTPAVLDLLDRYGARASFFCVGQRAAAHPQLVAEIVRRGHAVENHSQRHCYCFSMLGPKRMRREIEAAQAALQAAAGRAPQFFRAPAGLRNPFLAPVLAGLGLQLASWTRRGFDTVSDDPERVTARLVDGLAAGDILLLHDGNAAHTAAGRPVVLEVLPRLLEACAAQGLRPVRLDEACGGVQATRLP
jgi:peptidoglycan/xylan/chitin deacetylase (PgdA/CDA1 family)